MNNNFCRKPFLKAAYILILCLGIYNSLLAALGFAYIESDYSDTAMLWYGFHEHGWPFIKTWLYTQDNWLLSLLPLHALLFAIFSPSRQVIVLSGFIIFLANVLLCALIARSLRAKKTALLAPLLLLFAGEFAYVGVFITYPISHNITNFFGLLSLLFSLEWIKRRQRWALLVLFLCTIIGGLSDPWYLPCYGVPMIVASLWMMKRRPSSEYSNYIYLSGALILALVANSTHLFGLLDFLPKASYGIATWRQMEMQFLYLFKHIGWYINFMPDYTLWSALVSLVLLFILSGWMIWQLKKHFPVAPERQFFFLMIGLSIVILAISFILYYRSVPRTYLIYNRYFLNIFFFAILGLTLSAEIYWQRFPKLIQIGLLALAILYVIGGLKTTLPLWKHRPAIAETDYDQLRAILARHGWSYGYANYWSANVITWLSGNTLRVRPVGFSAKGQIYLENRVQSSPFWYLPADVPAGQAYFFVYAQHNETICPDVSRCQRGLTEQFGPPAHTLPYKDGIIMVWSHPIYPLTHEDSADEYQYHADPYARGL